MGADARHVFGWWYAVAQRPSATLKGRCQHIVGFHFANRVAPRRRLNRLSPLGDGVVGLVCTGSARRGVLTEPLRSQLHLGFVNEGRV